MATLWEPPQPPPLHEPDAPPADDAPPPFPWYAPFLVGIAIYVGLGVVVAIVGVAAGWTQGNIPDRFVLIATMFQDAALVAGAFIVAHLTSSRPVWDLGLRRVPPGRPLLYAGVAFLVFFVFLLV